MDSSQADYGGDTVRPWTENAKLRALRAELIAHLRQSGITDEGVLKVMGRLPRHAFVESGLMYEAYDDRALPIAQDQTISQPYTVAFQTQLLRVQPRDRVLEIGTGSGYQCAVLCKLGAVVFSVERHLELHRRARRTLRQVVPENTPLLSYGDGTEGWPQHAPYDGILVTAASPETYTIMKEQLAVGGRLVIPVGDDDGQEMYRVTRETQTSYRTEAFGRFRFVPLVGKYGWQTGD